MICFVHSGTMENALLVMEIIMLTFKADVLEFKIHANTGKLVESAQSVCTDGLLIPKEDVSLKLPLADFDFIYLFIFQSFKN